MKHLFSDVGYNSNKFLALQATTPYKQSAIIQRQKTFLFLSWILFALLALLLGHLAESRRIKVNPRVKRKCEVLFSLKSFKHFNFRENFLTNHQNLSVLAKVFAKIIIFYLENNKYLQAVYLTCSRLAQIFAKTCQMCHQNIFTKMVTLFHMLPKSFAFFVIDLRNNQHLLIFARNFRENAKINLRKCDTENFCFNPS